MATKSSSSFRTGIDDGAVATAGAHLQSSQGAHLPVFGQLSSGYNRYFGSIRLTSPALRVRGNSRFRISDEKQSDLDSEY